MPFALPGFFRTLGFDPASLSPLLWFDMQESMMAPLASESLDLDPANPSTLDIITATRAGTATYTDASGNIQTASPNTVRVDHVDGVPMILVEPSATNLVDYSNLAGGWSQLGFSVTQNAILSPDGSVNGTKLEQTSTTRTFSGAFIPSATDTVVTYSFWVKKGSGATHLNQFNIRGSFYPFNQKGSINLETGEIIQNDFGAGNLIVEAYPNGWFKVKATRDTDINIGDAVLVYPPYASSDGSIEIGQYNYTFGHQLEYGTVATSFIPTSGSTVTRAADDLVIDGSDFTNFYNQSEGTFYVEFTPKDLTDGEQYLLRGGDINRRIIYSNGSIDNIRIYDGANVLTVAYNSVESNALHRIAVSFDSTTMKGTLDGATEVTSTHNGNLLASTELEIGPSYIGHLKRLIYWPHHSDSI